MPYAAKMRQRVEGRQAVRKFYPGDNILIANHVDKRKWDLGVIVREIALCSYLVKIGKREVKRHIDDIIINHSSTKPSDQVGDSWMYAKLDPN